MLRSYSVRLTFCSHVEVTIRKYGYPNVQYHEVDLDRAPEAWDGELATLPSHAHQVEACAKAVNTVGLSTTICAEPIMWDARAPFVTAKYFHPITQLVVTPSGCAARYDNLNQDNCAPLYTNQSRIVKVQASFRDDSNISYARWSMFNETRLEYGSLHLLSLLKVPGSENLERGSGPPHEDGSLGPAVPLPLLSMNSQLEHNVSFYAHFAVCDRFQNCEVRIGPPLVYDATGPPLTADDLIADRSTNTSANRYDQYFIFSRRVQPRWNGLSQNLPVRDPESGDSEAWWSLFHVGEIGEMTLLEGPYHRPTVSYDDVQRPLEYPLVNGEKYVLQVFLRNPAGGYTNTYSRPIVYDATPPVCNNPHMSSMCIGPTCPLNQTVISECTSYDGAGRCNNPPPGGSTWGGIRGITWIGPFNKGFRVRLSHSTCVDPESGAHARWLAIGSTQQREGARLQEVGPGPGDDLLPFERVHNMGSVSVDMEVSWPLEGGHPPEMFDPPNMQPVIKHFVSVECMNGAAQTKVCNTPPPIFHVDTTAPVCNDEHVMALLGEGHNPSYQNGQAINSSLLLSKLDWALSPSDMETGDPETGIGGVSYELQDLSAGTSQALASSYHVAMPVHKMRIPGLLLQHGHEYQVTAYPFNGVGMMGTPCVSTTTIVDFTPPEEGRVFIVHSDDEMHKESPHPARFQYSQEVLRIVARNFTDPESGIWRYRVGIYRTDGMIIAPMKPIPGGADYALTPCQLFHGQSFYVKWEAVNGAELTKTVTSWPVTIDTSPPIALYVRDFTLNITDVDIVATDELDVVAYFDGYDLESGMLRASMCVGSFPGACDASDLEPINFKDRQARQSVANLADGARYFTTILMINGAGEWAMATSNGFKVDVSGPYCGSVFDGPSFDREFFGPNSVKHLLWESDELIIATGDLELTWADFVDYGSGVGGYHASLVRADLIETVNATNTAWVHTGLGESAVVPSPRLIHGHRYHTAVNAYDKLGNERLCTSDGMVFDATPPNVSLATISNLLAAPRYFSYGVQRADHTVHFVVAGIFDPESLLRQMYAAVSTTPGVTPPFEEFYPIGTTEGEALIGGLHMEDGEVDVIVRAVNNAFEHSMVPIKIGVDTTRPRCSAVSINGKPPDAFQFTTETNYLMASWDCEDAAPWEHAPLVCQWAVGTYPRAADTMAWRIASRSGTHTFHAEGDAPLENGIMYFVTVKCTDQVELATSVVSGGLMPDLNPPFPSVRAVMIHPRNGMITDYWGHGSNISFIYDFADLESGVRRARASIDFDPACPSGPNWLDQMPVSLDPSPIHRQVVVSLGDLGLSLVHNSRYYLHVAAEDAMNHTGCSEPAHSILVDLTPPNCTLIRDRIGGKDAPPFFSTRAGLATRWACHDPESSVAFSRWMPYELAPDQTQHRALLTRKLDSAGGNGAGATAVHLVQGARYFSCVTAVNRAGLFAPNLCSPGAVFDGTPPAMGFIRDGSGLRYQSVSHTACALWGPMIDIESGVSRITWELHEIYGDVETQLATATWDEETADSLATYSAGGAFCQDIDPPLEHGKHYASRLTVWNNAVPSLGSRVTARGFTVDHTPPTSGTATLRVVFPHGFDSQAGFSASPPTINGLVIRVILDGFEDVESRIEHIAIRVYADGVLISEGNAPFPAEVFDSLPLTLANGTSIAVDAVPYNYAALGGPMVVSEPELVLVSDIQVRDPWLADGLGYPLTVQSITADGPDARSSVSLGFARAVDPVVTNVMFTHDWAIRHTPCQQPNVVVAADRLHEQITQRVLPRTTELNKTITGKGAIVHVKAFDVTLEQAGRYCAFLHACALPTETHPMRCKNVSSLPVTIDISPPSIHVGTPRALNESGSMLPMSISIECNDAETTVTEAYFSVGSTRGGYDLIRDMKLELNASSVEESESSPFSFQSSNASGFRGVVTLGPAHLSFLTDALGGRIFASVYCRNAIGLADTVVSLPRIVDTEEPTAGVLVFPTLAWSERDSAHVGGIADSLEVRWSGFADVGTGLRSFIVCAGSLPPSCLGADENVVATQQHHVGISGTTLDLSALVAGSGHSTEIYVSVTAIDGRNLHVETTSRIVFDATLPTIGNLTFSRLKPAANGATFTRDSAVLLELVGGAFDEELQVDVAWSVVDASQSAACVFSRVAEDPSSATLWEFVAECSVADQGSHFCIEAHAQTALGASDVQRVCLTMDLSAPEWGAAPSLLREPDELLLSWPPPTSNRSGPCTVRLRLCTYEGCDDEAHTYDHTRRETSIPNTHPLLVNYTGDAWVELTATSRSGVCSKPIASNLVVIGDSGPGPGSLFIVPAKAVRRASMARVLVSGFRDPLLPMANFSYCIGLFAGDSTAVCRNETIETEVPDVIELSELNGPIFERDDSHRLVVTAKACNVFGVCSTGISQVIMVDVDAPSIASVADGLVMHVHDRWSELQQVTCDDLVCSSRAFGFETSDPLVQGDIRQLVQREPNVLERSVFSDILGVSWSGIIDPTSSIGAVYLAFGSKPGAADALPWTRVHGNEGHLITAPLNLTDRVVYYASIRAIDLAGNAATLSSVGARFFSAAPRPPSVEVLGEVQVSCAQAAISWLPAIDPNCTGMEHYVQLCTMTGTCEPEHHLTGAPSELNLTASMARGVAHEVAITAIGCGANVTSHSGAFTCDDTPPVMSAVVAHLEQEDYRSLQYPGSASVAWEGVFAEAEGQIHHFDVCLASPESVASCANWHRAPPDARRLDNVPLPSTLSAGHSALAVVRASSAGGHSRSLSNTVDIDHTAPLMPISIMVQGARNGSCFLGTTRSIPIVWHSAGDPNSGIQAFETAVTRVGDETPLFHVSSHRIAQLPPCSETFASAVCAGPNETCFRDTRCSSGDDPHGGLGCNAGGVAWDCRFCGFAQFWHIPCPTMDNPGAAAVYTAQGSNTIPELKGVEDGEQLSVSVTLINGAAMSSSHAITCTLDLNPSEPHPAAALTVAGGVAMANGVTAVASDRVDLRACWQPFSVRPSGISEYLLELASSESPGLWTVRQPAPASCANQSVSLEEGVVYTLRVSAVSGAGLLGPPAELQIVADLTPPAHVPGGTRFWVDARCFYIDFLPWREAESIVERYALCFVALGGEASECVDLGLSTQVIMQDTGVACDAGDATGSWSPITHAVAWGPMDTITGRMSVDMHIRAYNVLGQMQEEGPHTLTRGSTIELPMSMVTLDATRSDGVCGAPTMGVVHLHASGQPLGLLIGEEFADHAEWVEEYALCVNDVQRTCARMDAPTYLALSAEATAATGLHNVTLAATSRDGGRALGVWPVMVDGTAPTMGEVRVGIDRSEVKWGDRNEFVCSWDEATDPESGISEYNAALVEASPNCAVNPESRHGGRILATGSAGCDLRNLTLRAAMVHGNYYYCVLVAKNGAGLRAKASSDGVQLETAPSETLNSAVELVAIDAPSGAVGNFSFAVNASIDLLAIVSDVPAVTHCTFDQVDDGSQAGRCWNTTAALPFGGLQEFAFTMMLVPSLNETQSSQVAVHRMNPFALGPPTSIRLSHSSSACCTDSPLVVSSQAIEALSPWDVLIRPLAISGLSAALRGHSIALIGRDHLAMLVDGQVQLVDLTANELNVRVVSLTEVCGDNSGDLGTSAAEVLGASTHWMLRACGGFTIFDAAAESSAHGLVHSLAGCENGNATDIAAALGESDAFIATSCSTTSKIRVHRIPFRSVSDANVELMGPQLVTDQLAVSACPLRLSTPNRATAEPVLGVASNQTIRLWKEETRMLTGDRIRDLKACAAIALLTSFVRFLDEQYTRP